MVDGNRKSIFPADFGLHSLLHTMAITIGSESLRDVRFAGHSSITVSQYIRPPRKPGERAFKWFQLSAKVQMLRTRKS
jgi:hypothetical protein